MGQELICSNSPSVIITTYVFVTSCGRRNRLRVFSTFRRSQGVWVSTAKFSLNFDYKIFLSLNYNPFSFFILLFYAGGKTPDVGSRTYAHIIREQQLRAEEQEVTIMDNLWCS